VSKFFFFLFSFFLFHLSANAQDAPAKEREGFERIDSLLAADTTLSSVPVANTDTINSDSVSIMKKKLVDKRHSPKKAIWMSAILPGLGQGYNKRWWKIPVIYAGFSGLGYGLYHFGTNYNGYRGAYRIAVDGDSTTNASYKGTSTAAELKFYRDSNKRNLDIMAVITAFWYILNIVDAAVDAHLFHWDVDDKLALDIHPMIPQMSGRGVAGLNLQFSFRQAPKRKIFQL